MLEHDSHISPDSKPARRIAPGYVVVMATDPALTPAFFSELRQLVAASQGGILVCLDRPTPWPGGPVVGVHLRRAEQALDGRLPRPRRSATSATSATASDVRDPVEAAGLALGPGLWLGPLRHRQDRINLCHWLRAGGPGAGPPSRALRKRMLASPTTPLMARHTSN